MTTICFLFVFIGGGSIKGLVAEIGGKMTAEAFNLILKKFDLDVSHQISHLYFDHHIASLILT